MRCSHTAPPCDPTQLARPALPHVPFRNPAGRSRGKSNMSPRRSHPPSSRRTDLLRVRLSKHEREAIRSRADLCRKPLSTFVREVALGSIPRARPGRLEEKAIYHLGRIGNNLNQLARAANTTGRLVDERRLGAALDELLAAIRRLA